MFSAADMPTTSNPAFLLWLNKHFFSSVDVTVGEDVDSNKKEKDSIIDILWCYVEQLSKPSILFPSCAVLTKRNFFIERLTSLESSFPGVPELKPCSMISIQNIQQLVLGPCHSYMRLEEAFVGKGGVFTLFGIEPQGLKRFFNNLFNACCRFDIINSYSFIDLTVRSDLLTIIVSREDNQFQIPSDRLVSASLVQLKNDQMFNFLVLSENRVYCLDLACVHWPPASFETSPEPSIRFNVHHEFSIMDKINSIKIISPSDGHLPDSRTNTTECAVADTSRDVQFLKYELSLNVSISVEAMTVLPSSGTNSSEGMSESAQKHGASIIYYFSSAASRDLFLDRLSNMRSELAHRMSPNVREEPEGGNEQLSHSDRHRFKPWSVPSTLPKPLVVLSRDISLASGQTTHKDATVGASYNDMLSSAIVIQGSCNSDYRFHEKAIIGELDQSNIAVTMSDTYLDNRDQTRTLTNSTASYSSSPKDELSVSPMSNFSRASISPVAGLHEPNEKTQRLSQATVFAHDMSTTKADSLPSSFDWKQYYFKSLPSSTQDSISGHVVNKSRLTGDSKSEVSSRSDLFVEIHNRKPLEDIESSSELEPEVNLETEHESYLKQCLLSYDLVHPLSTKLKPLCLMNGRELKKFFHSTIAQKIYSDNHEILTEELHYVVWSMVVPYTNPKHEIITLVMMSTYGIYLVSDTSPKMAHKTRPSWMTHSRNRSDSAITLKSGTSTGGRQLVEPYFVFRYKDLLQVNIGLFDQCVRLTGRNENSVFTIATRDGVMTEIFIQKLKHVLSFVTVSPLLEKSRTETESDFYKASMQRTKSTLDGIVYTHPSRVKFVYPGDDAVRDILYLVNARVGSEIKVSTSVEGTSRIWFYMQCYLLPSDDGRARDRSQPRSVVITATHFCLAEEDIVTYPLPDFVRGVPENPCHDIVECRRVDSLKRITLAHGSPHIVCLTFLDEVQDIVVDVSMQHFGQLKAEKEKQLLCPEVTYRLFVQSVKERDKMVQVLDTLWKGLVTQVGRILDINRTQQFA